MDAIELPDPAATAATREGHPDEGDEQRGQQATGPPDPELAEIDAARAPFVPPRIELDDEERRDQEPGQDEEQVDAEEPTREAFRSQVERDDGRDREAAKPVQPGHRAKMGPWAAPACSRVPKTGSMYPSDFRLIQGRGRLYRVATASMGELELVPVATTVPSIAVLYRSEHVAMVRRLSLMGSTGDLAEHIAHRRSPAWAGTGTGSRTR